mmetsp:Transcript_30848/g.78099  ORF Transcript_30848/g.78099 Transcript_30848/m.78099 type:complete len:132 (+) Transcript_30848:105-500(+)
MNEPGPGDVGIETAWMISDMMGYEEQMRSHKVQVMYNIWKDFRSRCNDRWMNEIENEDLMQAHEGMKEVISRCRVRIDGGGNHVAVIGPCHAEVMGAWRRCQAAVKLQPYRPPEPAPPATTSAPSAASEAR